MKRLQIACTLLLLAAVLAGCRSNGDNMFAARDRTVEYYRVFDIRTNAAPDAVTKAASAGIERNVKGAEIATPAAAAPAAPGEAPGRLQMAAPGTAPSASACEGAAWSAKAAPAVRGGDNMHLIACLFPYRSGYHLDMYAVFTRPEGGLLAWPRRLGGAVLGTPEQFTESTMMDLVRAIREGTGATISLVEARPELAGAPWMGTGPGRAAQDAAAPATAAVAAPPAPVQPPAAVTAPVAAPVAAPAAPIAPVAPVAPVALPATAPAPAPAAAPAPAPAPTPATAAPPSPAVSATMPDALR
ncbi:hypothetical protein [uncultured Massilia sp.]|uniref:hypothetical protein n=1 Tax=uncultured Massilia sp. TaxID=169973 RepID=UPI0025FD0018|nr:hypothetical protein [uncultured Massilia sp.]